jgi:hypothetical protein
MTRSVPASTRSSCRAIPTAQPAAIIEFFARDRAPPESAGATGAFTNCSSPMNDTGREHLGSGEGPSEGQMNIKTLAAGGAALLAVAAAAIYGVDAYAEREAGAQVEASFAHLPRSIEGRHGAVSYSILRDRLVLADVAIDVPDQWFRSLHAARVEVTGLNHGFLAALLSRAWGQGEDAWTAGAVVASTVEYDLANGVHQAADRVVVNDPRITLAGAAPPEQWTLAQWLAALSWSSGEATNFRATLEAAPGSIGFSTGAGSRAFGELKAGRLAGVIDRGLAWEEVLPDFGKLHLDIGEARANGIDLLALDKIFDPASYRDDQRDPAFLALCDDISLAKVTMTIAGPSTVALALDDASVVGFKMRQLPFPPNAPPTDPTSEQSFDLLRSVALGSMTLDKMTLTSPEEAESALGFDRLAVRFDDKNHAEIANLKVKSPDTSLVLGSMQLDGLAVRFPEKLLGALNISDSPDAPPPARPAVFLEHYELSDLVFQHKTVGELSLKSLTLGMTGSIDQPTGGSFALQRLGVDLATVAQNPGAAMLGTLGYGQVFFEAQGNAAYDADARTIDSHLSFGAPEMGTLRLSYRLGNYDLDWRSGDTGTLIEQAMDVALQGFEFRYDDASLADHVIDAMAAQAGQPSAAMRQSFVTTLEQEKSAHAGELLVVSALDAALDFVVKPTSIRLAAQPAKPVTLGQLSQLGLSKPNDLMMLLGVTVDRPQPNQ